MKRNIKMSRAVGSLEGLYNRLNNDFFEGKLPVPIITVQSKPGTYGHCSNGKIWKRNDEDAYEMNIAAEVLNDDVEEILDTMLHEMIHLYCRENGIKEVSRGGKYHNARFKKEAERVGLYVFKTEKYGYNTLGKGNEKLIEYALSIGFYGIEIARNTPMTITGIQTPIIQLPQNNTGGRTSSTRKYQCPICRTSFRATKDLTRKVICADCQKYFEEV